MGSLLFTVNNLQMGTLEVCLQYPGILSYNFKSSILDDSKRLIGVQWKLMYRLSTTRVIPFRAVPNPHWAPLWDLAKKHCLMKGQAGIIHKTIF